MTSKQYFHLWLCTLWRSPPVHHAGLQLEHQQLRSLHPGHDGALIYKADLNSTLLDVILFGFLQPAGQDQVVHRVGVFEMDNDVSDADVSDDDVSDGDDDDDMDEVVKGIRWGCSA